VKTLVFALIVAGLAAFSLLDYKQFKKDKGLGENEQKVLSLHEGEVVDIEIKSKKQTVSIKSDHGYWHILEPLKDDADDLAIVSYLNALKEAKVTLLSDDGKKNSEPVDWSKYGLDPGVQIEIITDQNKKDRFTVSDTSAYDGSFYVRKGDDLFLGDRSLARISDVAVKTLRSHNIWRSQGDILSAKLHYRYMGQTKDVVLSKGEKDWSVEPKFDLPLSQDKVKDWLQAIRDIRANDFASPESVKKPSSWYEFTVQHENQKQQVTWKFEEQAGNKVNVLNSILPDAYQTTSFTLRDVLLPAEQLLDTASVFNIALEKANDVLLSIEGKSLHFKKGEADWTMEGSTKFKPAALVEFFQKLKGLEPIAAEPPKDLQFEPEKNALTIKGSTGVLFEMTWSQSKDQLRWLKISQFKERFKVSAERLNALLKTNWESHP
jgi:hypothetical protein